MRKKEQIFWAIKLQLQVIIGNAGYTVARVTSTQQQTAETEVRCKISAQLPLQKKTIRDRT